MRADLKKLIEAPKTDINKADAKIDAIGKIQTQNMKEMVHLLVKIKAELTPDQIQKAKDYIKTKMQERRGDGRGGQFGGGAPSGDDMR